MYGGGKGEGGGGRVGDGDGDDGGGGDGGGDGDGGEGLGGGSEGGGGDGGGDGIKNLALLEPSPVAVRSSSQSVSLILKAFLSWSSVIWKILPSPESGAFVALVAMVPKQIVFP